VHINTTKYPDWLNPLRKHEWRDQGIVVWDATTQVVTHLYANYALKILEILKETDTWKTEDLIIGSPAYRMSILDTTDEQLENKGLESPKTAGC